MSLGALGWLFTLGVILHNAEEAVFLPAWTSSAGRWHPRVGTREFAFAAAVLSLVAVVLATLGLIAGAGSVWAHLFAGYVFTMVANVFIPHALGSIALRRYMPGTGTALLLNLPLGLLFLQRAVAQGFVRSSTLVWVAPMTAVAIVASIPALFAIGRLLPVGNGLRGTNATPRPSRRDGPSLQPRGKYHDR